MAHHRHDISGPASPPTGTLVVSTVRDEPDAALTMAAALHAVDLAGGDLRALPGPAGALSLSHPSFSPDGTRIAALAEDVVLAPSFGRVVVVATGGGEPTVLTAGLDRQAAQFVGVRPPLWRDEHLVFAVEDHGIQQLYRVPAAGGTPEPLRTGPPAAPRNSCARSGPRSPPGRRAPAGVGSTPTTSSPSSTPSTPPWRTTRPASACSAAPTAGS